VDGLKAIPEVLADADPALKAKVYSELGVRITYEPGNRLVVAEARLACTTGVSEEGPNRSPTQSGGWRPVRHSSRCWLDVRTVEPSATCRRLALRPGREDVREQ
jgi:hypothetical protein